MLNKITGLQEFPKRGSLLEWKMFEPQLSKRWSLALVVTTSKRMSNHTNLAGLASVVMCLPARSASAERVFFPDE